MSLSERDFRDQVAALSEKLRRDIEAAATGLDTSKEAIAKRRRRVLKDGDFGFFAKTYFPHHIWGKFSLFQAHFCKRFPRLLRSPDGCREWWVAPRGEAKSTLATKVGPCWVAVRALLEKPAVRRDIGWKGAPPRFIDYVLLLGAETQLPTLLLAVIKTELEFNPQLAIDFPEVVGQGPSWKVGEIVTRQNVKFKPFGADQAVRGTFHGASRPGLALGDDLIKDSDAASTTVCSQRWEWLTKAVDNLGPPDGTLKSINVGTNLSRHDPVSRARQAPDHNVHTFRAIETMPKSMDLWEECERLMRNEDKELIRKNNARDRLTQETSLPSYQFYIRHRKRMEAGAVTSWPGVRSLYTLMRKRALYPKAFASEMQGMARSEDEGVFTGLSFWVSRLPHWVFYGACDPSMGIGQHSHPSCIMVAGWDTNTKKMHVIHSASKRRLPSKLSADLIAAQEEFGPACWGFENNNAYEHMRTTLMKDAAAAGVVLPMIGLPATVAPEVRIDSLEPHCTGIDPLILFHAQLLGLLDELDQWPDSPDGHHYDSLCALYILRDICVARGSGLPDIRSAGAGGGVNLRNY